MTDYNYTEQDLAAGKAAYEHWLKIMDERNPAMFEKDTPAHLKPPAWENAMGSAKDLFILAAQGAIAHFKKETT